MGANNDHSVGKSTSGIGQNANNHRDGAAEKTSFDGTFSRSSNNQKGGLQTDNPSNNNGDAGKHDGTDASGKVLSGPIV